MVKWTVGETNFYVVLKRKLVEEQAQAAVNRELLLQSIIRPEPSP